MRSDLALLMEGARLGSETALRYWGSSPDVWDKGDGQGPVSEADLAVDKALGDFLRTARPSYGWLSEETEDDRTRLGAECVFIVDPIDGTRSFLGGERTWAISLAVARRGKIEAAAVALPSLNKLYSSMAGAGAYNNGVSIRASDRQSTEGARVLAARASLDPNVWGEHGPPPVERHFRPSLAYRLCLVAEGRFDAMITFRDCWEWDIAAGALIATEAGAHVSDRRGVALSFNSSEAKTPGAIAASPALQPALVPPAQRA